MAKLSQPYIKKDFMSGMVSDVSIGIVPPNSVALGVNLDFDDILGAATSRLGTTQVGSQLVAGKTLLGLYQHVDPITPSNNLLFGALNAVGDATATIKNVLTGADVVTGLTPDTKVRFLTYGGETVAVNGADAPRAWNGSAWVTTGGVFDLGDWSANESSLVIEYLDRIYANDETIPYRVHYSEVFDGSAVSWNDNYVDIEAEGQGGKITAFAKVPGYVLFFKERSLHRWNFSSAFPESLVNVGTPSQESVVESGGLVFFYSNSSDDARGFYVTNGGRPQSISKDTSRTIRRFVDAITPANETKIAAVATDRVIQWSVGDLTVDGVNYSNVVFRYNRILNQWSIRTYPSQFSVYTNYLVGGVNSFVTGDNDGNVFRIDAPGVYTDNGQDVHYKLTTHQDNFGTNRLKRITDVAYVRGEKLNDLHVSVIPNGDDTLRESLVKPTLLKKILTKLNIGKRVDGTTLGIELTGTASTGKAVIMEIEFPSITITENYE